MVEDGRGDAASTRSQKDVAMWRTAMRDEMGTGLGGFAIFKETRETELEGEGGTAAAVLALAPVGRAFW